MCQLNGAKQGNQQGNHQRGGASTFLFLVFWRTGGSVWCFFLSEGVTNDVVEPKLWFDTLQVSILFTSIFFFEIILWKSNSCIILGYFIRSCFKTCSNSAMLGIFIAALLSVGRLYTSTTSYSGTTGSHLRLFPTMTYFTAYLAITPNLCNLAVVLITTIYKSKDESLSHGVCDW